MKICSYTMTSDTGFAPNPFHGCCTLAACTPNHMGAKLEKGDWVAGFFTDSRVPCLVYAMQIDQMMGYDGYYHARRFQDKKPCLTGRTEDRCGDNIYHTDRDGRWVRDKGPYHQDSRAMEQDTRHALVYIGGVYAYFGEKAYSNPLPDRLRNVLKSGQGIKYTRQDNPLLTPYRRWLEAKPRGIQGCPRDLPTGSTCTPCNRGASKTRSRTSRCT